MKKQRPVHTGASLIELVVAIIIVSIMMGLSAMLFTSATTDAAVKECRSNMQNIANLEEQYRIKSSGHSYTTTLSNLTSTGTTLPLCTKGGSYTVTISDGTMTAQNGQVVPSGQLIISCSSGHGKYAPGIDTY